MRFATFHKAWGIGLVALIIFLVAGRISSAATPSTPPLEPRPPSVQHIATSYTNFQRMTETAVSVTPELAMLCVEPSKEQVDEISARFGPHAHTYVQIYMNDLAAGAFTNQARQFPVGAVVVKQKYVSRYHLLDQEKYGRAKNGIGGMIKRSPGFDPAHGDWEYFYFDDLKKIESGRISSCVNCHESAKQDYVFGGWKHPSP